MVLDDAGVEIWKQGDCELYTEANMQKRAELRSARPRTAPMFPLPSLKFNSTGSLPPIAQPAAGGPKKQ